MESRITCENIDTIWLMAQMKHCAKPIRDLLPGLVKHLSAAPALHLYSLLVQMEPKDHIANTNTKQNAKRLIQQLCFIGQVVCRLESAGHYNNFGTISKAFRGE